MGFFKRLSRMVLGGNQPSEAGYWIAVQCDRCGEIIRSRVNIYNDLSLEYSEAGKPTYFCRKTLMGEGHCFQRIEVELTFDANRKLIEENASGGKFVPADG